MAYTISSTTVFTGSSPSITNVYDDDSGLEGAAVLTNGTTVQLDISMGTSDVDLVQTLTGSDSTVIVDHQVVGADDTAGNQSYSKVVALPDGGYAIVWRSENGTADNYIYLAVFNSEGAQQGDKIRIDSGDTAGEIPNTVTVGTDGTISVIWYDGDATDYETLLTTNAAPVAIDDTANVLEGQSVVVDVVANDTDINGDALSVTQYAVSTGNGTVSLDSNGKLVVAYDGPDLDPGQTATIKVDYTVSDSHLTDSGVLTVTVTGVAEPGDTITGTPQSDLITGTNVGETILALGSDDTVYGLGGDDIINAGDGNDVVSGGAGNDKLLGGDGNDTISGVDGNDVISGGAGNDTINGGTGNDTITGGDGNDVISGADGNDTIGGGSGNDKVSGGAGNDILSGGDGVDALAGGDGNDTINGGNGDDTINGGAGKDTISGGNGNDVLIGGAGADTFIFGKLQGNDTITDFQATGTGHDIIDLSAFNLTFKALESLMSEVGSSVVIDLPGDNSIKLLHVDLDHLTKADFLL